MLMVAWDQCGQYDNPRFGVGTGEERLSNLLCTLEDIQIEMELNLFVDILGLVFRVSFVWHRIKRNMRGISISLLT